MRSAVTAHARACIGDIDVWLDAKGNLTN